MIIPKETPWAVLLCKFSPDLSKGNPTGYFAQVPRVVYRSQDNHINELAISQQTGQWDIQDITAKTGAPAAAGDPMGYLAQVPRVVYRGQDNHIYEIAIYPETGNWGLFDMTAATGAPAAAGDPMGYLAQVPRVVYRGQDNHIYEIAIYPETGNWGLFDMTAATGAPAAGDPMGYLAQVPRVVYRGQDNHIYEIAIYPETGSWGLFDMTNATGAPAAAGDPMGYFAQVPRVVYRGQDNHIYELAIYPETGGWGLFDMTAAPASVEPFPHWFYENLFTTSGIGFNNMIDFFRLFTHGNIDLNQSQVFGWLTLSHWRRDYTGSGVDPAGRQALIDWARQAASAAHIDLSPYSGVVVCMNVLTDLFGNLGEKAMVCDNNSMTPSLIAQEMLHGYGLDHSRADGSTADYQDQWDVMSTANAFMARDPNFRRIGPSLNAANIDSQGWLDPSRVWSAAGNFDETIDLRPHYRRDLPGFLVAKVGQFYVEFRVKEGWDAAIPQSAVLVHRFEDNHSYLMKGTSGQAALTEGNVFQQVDQVILPALTIVSRVEVLKIDDAARKATVHLSYKVSAEPG